MKLIQQLKAFCDARDAEERACIDANRYRADSDTSAEFEKAHLEATRARLAAQWALEDVLGALDRMADRAERKLELANIAANAEPLAGGLVCVDVGTNMPAEPLPALPPMPSVLIHSVGMGPNIFHRMHENGGEVPHA